MSKKLLRTVGKVAAVVAAGLAVATGVGAIAVGATILGASVATVTTIAGVVSLGAAMLGKPSANVANAATTDRLNVTLNPRAPRAMVFGKTAMGSDLCDQEFTGTDKEYLHRFVATAAHKVNSIQQIWFDDELAWTSSGGVQSAFSGYLTVATRLEGSSANAINISSRIGSARRFTGCAYVHLRFKLTGNGQKTDSPFAQQVPTRITIVGEGIPCYDVRQDGTRGGTGSHRADDQTTWTYGAHARNPACQLATWLLGWRIQNPSTEAWRLSVGKGIPADRIDWPSFLEAANLCDESISLSAGGTEPRYRGDGIITEGDDPMQVVDAFKAAMNADLDDQDGLIRLTVFHNDLATPEADFSDADLMGEYRWTQTPTLSDSYNIVGGTFVDPSPEALYQQVEYNEARLTAPDGIDRILNVSFGLVQSQSQAERLAKQRLQRGQYGGTFSATFLATGWRVQKNSVIRLTNSSLGWTNKLFRVVETAVRFDGTVPMVLREEHADIYAWDEEEGAAVQIAEPTQYAPGDAPIPQFLNTLEEGADVTGNNVSLDTQYVGGVPAEDVIEAMDATLGDLSELTDAIEANALAIAAAEGTITDLLGDMSDAQAAILTAQGQITTLTSSVSTLNSSVTTISTAISSIEGDLASLESTVSTQGSSITTNATAISTLNSNYSTLSSTVSTLGSTVSTQGSAITTINSNLATLTTNLTATLLRTHPIDMSGGSDYYSVASTTTPPGSAAGFESDGTVQVGFAYNRTAEFLPRWNWPAVPGVTYTLQVEADAAIGSPTMALTAYTAATPMGSRDTWLSASSAQTLTSGYKRYTFKYTVPNTPSAPYVKLGVIIEAESGKSGRIRSLEIFNSTDLGALTATVTTQASALVTLESSYASLTSTVTAQGVTISENATAISSIEGDVSTVMGKWGLSIETDGVDGQPNVVGVDLFNTGSVGLFRIVNAIFQIISTTGRGLTYGDDGVLWLKGEAISVMIGDNFGTGSDLMFWIGPNPASPAACTKANAVIWFDKNGLARFGGAVNNSDFAQKTFSAGGIAAGGAFDGAFAGLSTATMVVFVGSSGSVDLSAAMGATTFGAGGMNITYKWQYSSDGTSWSDVSGASVTTTVGAGVTAATLPALAGTKSGLTAGTAAMFRIALQVNSFSGTGNRSVYTNNPATAQSF